MINETSIISATGTTSALCTHCYTDGARQCSRYYYCQCCGTRLLYWTVLLSRSRPIGPPIIMNLKDAIIKQFKRDHRDELIPGTNPFAPEGVVAFLYSTIDVPVYRYPFPPPIVINFCTTSETIAHFPEIIDLLQYSGPDHHGYYCYIIPKSQREQK